jgi:hypothetical protein
MFVRQIAGNWLRNSVRSQKLLHVELGCMHISLMWLKMIWNRLCSLPRLLHMCCAVLLLQRILNCLLVQGCFGVLGFDDDTSS